MKILVGILSIIMLTASFLVSAGSAKKLYSQGAQNIFLVTSSQSSKSALHKHGTKFCSKESFCLIWYFNNSDQAKDAVNTMKSGNTWNSISGLIGIYSKNKIVNRLICYDPNGSC